LVKILLNYCLIEKIEQIEQGKINNKNVSIIISYHQLIQNGGLLLFLIPLAAATGKAALTNDAAASETYAEFDN